jgi:formylglycine-generating enzyme required for sulfatase activity
MPRRFLVIVCSLLTVGLAFMATPASSQPLKAQEPARLRAPFTEAEAKAARAEWAKFRNVPETKSVELGKGVKLELVLIPPGIFKMGTPRIAKDDEYPHDVLISQPFYMAVTETTQEQYAAIAGKNPSWFQKGEGGADKVQGKDTAKFPVEKVSWGEALEFCVNSGIRGVRIPTEAEWEYACKAGTNTLYSFGNAITLKQANFNDELHRTEKVGSYPANNFGLFDMHGNVLEWCWDGYRADYEKLPSINPVEERSNGRRILKGGSWYGYNFDCRSGNRFYFWDDFHYMDCGFRIVVMLPPE